MSTEGHRNIPRERMHRIAEIEGGFLPREQARCSGGSCRQGRAKCETPEACCTPVDDDMSDTSKALVIAASLAVALMALAAAVLPMIFN